MVFDLKKWGQLPKLMRQFELNRNRGVDRRGDQAGSGPFRELPGNGSGQFAPSRPGGHQIRPRCEPEGDEEGLA